MLTKLCLKCREEKGCLELRKNWNNISGPHWILHNEASLYSHWRSRTVYMTPNWALSSCFHLLVRSACMDLRYL